MIDREIAPELLESASEYPAVTLFGPRQSGKTTITKTLFGDLPYFSFENPDIKSVAQRDPRGFLKPLGNRAIFDEIQRVPELLSYLQEVLDENRGSARFILTGSHQPLLDQTVGQSLPGRTAVLTLMPFTYSEIARYKRKETVFESIHKGTYPGLHEHRLSVKRFYRSYVQTYVERDVRSLVNVQDLDRFQTFLALLAGRIGGLINLSSLSNDVGMSSTTLRKWLNVLKASYLIFELPPYHANIRKRIVKSTKLYFTDTGLACYLLGIDNADQLKRDRLRGGLFENFVVMEIYKTLLNRGESPALYFLRDHRGMEIDLLIKRGASLIPVEIKSAETFSVDFVESIHKFKPYFKDQLSEGYVVYGGTETFTIEGTKAVRIEPFFAGALLDKKVETEEEKSEKEKRSRPFRP